MKRLFNTVAVLVAFGSASPVFASDVSSDRYYPSQAAQRQARTSTMSEADAGAPTTKSPCHCACRHTTNQDERTAHEPGGR